MQKIKSIGQSITEIRIFFNHIKNVAKNSEFGFLDWRKKIRDRKKIRNRVGSPKSSGGVAATVLEIENSTLIKISRKNYRISQY